MVQFKKILTVNKKQVVSSLAHFWEKIHTTLFFILFFSLIILGGYIWKQSLYGKGWSEAKKQEYMNTQNKRVIFKEDDFNKIVSDIQTRKNENSDSYQPIKDIFEPYK
jgi:hypothetical protein